MDLWVLVMYKSHQVDKFLNRDLMLLLSTIFYHGFSFFPLRVGKKEGKILIIIKNDF